uniref:RNA-directed DNA polymerase from transposon BS n=1 Tax=Haemonchus placei TaxID=6290 RepID=A0A0N4WH65_HAEPC
MLRCCLFLVQKLPLSIEKTKVVHLSSRKCSRDDHFEYRIDGNGIRTVDGVVDLGFMVKPDLSFDSHCEMIAGKGLNAVHRLFRALTTRNPSVLLQAFKVYVRPLVEYGTVVFSPHKRKIIDKIEKVQNSFTRKLMIRVVGFMYDSIPSAAERNANFGLRSLCWRRKKFDLLTFHKVLTGSHCLHPSTFYTIRASTTRNGPFKLVPSKSRLNCRSHFFVNRVHPLYFALSKKKSIPISSSSFKKYLNEYLEP